MNNDHKTINLNVLIVDDEANIRKTLSYCLTCKSLYPHLGKAFRVAIFETVSALTTIGFSTVSYGNWNAFGLFILIVLMLVGGGTCSTAGGIKQFRIHLLWKLLIWEFKRAMMPRQAILDRSVWEGDKRILVDDTRIRQISAFIFLYMAIYGAGVSVMCACGFSLQDALFEFASAIGTVGISCRSNLRHHAGFGAVG